MLPTVGSVLILLLADKCLGKVTSGSVLLDGVNTEHEMAKFSYWVGGRGSVEAKFWVEKIDDEVYSSGALTMYAYRGEDVWRQVLKMPTCEQKVSLATWKQPIGRLGEHSIRKPIFQGKRTQVWFFTVADCSLEEFFHTVPVVHYRVETTGPMGRHLPTEEHGMGKLHFFNFVASGGGTVAYARYNGGNMHVAVAALLFVGIADSLASFFELVHVRAYESNGTGSYFCDALSAQLEALCDATIALLLFAIGAGWTLRASLSDDEKAGRSPLRDETVWEKAASCVAPLVSVLRYPLALPPWILLLYVGSHLGLAQWSRTYSDDFESFHDYEHLPGRVLVVLRLFMAAAFVPVLLHSQACAGERLRRFYVGWATVGTLWFLSLPVLSVTASLFPAHLRHSLVSGGAALSTTAALSLLALLFAGKVAPYYHAVSTVGSGDANLDFGSPAAIAPSSSSTIASTLANAQAKLPTSLKLASGNLKVRID